MTDGERRAAWLAMWEQIGWNIRLELLVDYVERFAPHVLERIKALKLQIENIDVDVRKTKALTQLGTPVRLFDPATGKRVR